MSKMMALIGLAAGLGFSQTGSFPTPITKQHVKIVNGAPTKFVSKFKKLAMLNFTMGNGHQSGKVAWRTVMNRLPTEYAVNGTPAFTIANFESAADGSGSGVPNFTATDLNAADVIFANNVSMFGDAQLGAAKQQAIQQAIETNGKGYFGVHGSGDNQQTAWPWYTNVLHPMNYNGHAARTQGPIYKHLAEKDHMILWKILETKTAVRASVPNELDAQGNEAMASNIPTRNMLNEWYEFGRDISRDPAFASKVTILLKYDGRVPLADGSLPQQYIRKGGNLFTYLYKVGNGMTSFAPPGHDPDEVTNPTGTFDGGTGDLDRYVMALLYHLAGYTSSPCDASCDGLPLVDTADQYKGEAYKASTGIFLGGNSPRFFADAGIGTYEASLRDIRGKVLERKSGTGRIEYEFAASRYGAGVYFLSLRVAGHAPRIKRYVVAP
jgi:hypothetical protein